MDISFSYCVKKAELSPAVPDRESSHHRTLHSFEKRPAAQTCEEALSVFVLKRRNIDDVAGDHRTCDRRIDVLILSSDKRAEISYPALTLLIIR